MKIFIDTKKIIKKYRVPYARINYLTRTGLIKVAKKKKGKRLYSLKEIDDKFKTEKII